MSLRYKALAAVLVLVVAVTGSLAAFVSQLYEDSERARIQSDLENDAKRLRNILKAAAESAVSVLKPYIEDSALQEFLSSEQMKSGFQAFTDEWTSLPGSEIAIAALDSFLADAARPEVLHKTKSLVITSLSHQGLLSDEQCKALVRSSSLAEILETSYEKTLYQVGVISLDGVAMYVVATPFFEIVGEDREKAGLAVVLVRLTDQWVKENRLTVSENPIQQLIHVGSEISGHNAKDNATAHHVLSAVGEGEEFQLEGERFIGRRESFEGSEAIGFVAFKSLDRELGPLRILRRNVLLAGTVLAVIGLIAAYGTAWLLIRRIERLRKAAMRVKEGDFDTVVTIRGRDELDSLGRTFNDMVSGLKALGLYTDPKLAQQVMESRDLMESQGARQEGSFFFCDVQDFTSITETMEAERLIDQLNEFFTAMGRRISAANGYLDKFIGDNVMAYWGPPFLQEKDYSKRVCRAALSCMESLLGMQEVWTKQGKPPFHIRVGISTGTAIIGNIGSDKKKNFTAIGDPVNLASRLEGANKFYGTRILVDENTFTQAGDEFLFREIDQIRVKGKNQAVRIYELCCYSTQRYGHVTEVVDLYGKALKAYRGMEFRKALETLDRIDKLEKKDGPAGWLRKRCQKFVEAPPKEGWDPITTAREK